MTPYEQKYITNECGCLFVRRCHHADLEVELREVRQRWQSVVERDNAAAAHQDVIIHRQGKRIQQLEQALRSADPWTWLQKGATDGDWMCMFCKRIQTTPAGSEHETSCIWWQLAESKPEDVQKNGI